MGTAYLVALVVGLGTILVQLALSADSAADGASDGASFDGGTRHAGGEFVPSAHASPALGGDTAPLAMLFSLRFWTFASLAFGLLGSVLHFFGLASFGVTLGGAIVIGVFSGWAASWTFRVLGSAATNSGAESGELLGQLGKVMLVPNAEGRGKVRLRVKGQLVDYLATTDAAQLEVGASVLVEEVRGNQVHVSPAPSGLTFSE